MRPKPLFLCGCIALLSFTFVGVATAADMKIEQTLRDLDAQWSSAAEARDLDKMLSFYAGDAIVLPAHASIATTADAIRAIWKNLLTNPGIALSWKTTKVDVAQSGDIAYTTGTYQLTAPDDSGKPTTDHGKYVAIWKKQTGGSWKVTVDIWNTDIPLPAPPEKK